MRVLTPRFCTLASLLKCSTDFNSCSLFPRAPYASIDSAIDALIGEAIKLPVSVFDIAWKLTELSNCKSQFSHEVIKRDKAYTS